MIYLHKRNTGMGRLAREMRLSVAIKNPNTQTFLAPTWRLNSLVDTDGLPIGLNWGCGRGAIATLPSFGTLLNREIGHARNKTAAFERFAEADILCPRWSRSAEELRSQLREGRTILGRIDGQSGGSGIIEIPALATHWDQASFYVEKLSCQREIRVHVWRGNVIATQVKVVPRGCDNFIHSYSNGCTFSQDLAKWGINDELKETAEGLSIRAVASVGLDFGAVDLILTRKGKLYVLEVNSAPGIRCDYIKGAYRNALAPLIRRRGR